MANYLGSRIIIVFALTLLYTISKAQNNPDSTITDSIFLLQDSLLKNTQMEIFESIYPKVVDSDKKKLEIIERLIELTTRKEDWNLAKYKLKEVAKSDTTDWTINTIIFNSDWMDFLFEKKIHFIHVLDWKEQSFELANYINNSIKRFSITPKNFIVTDKLGEESIDKTYKTYGNELSNKGLLLINMDINCDCYIPFVILPKDSIEVKNIITRLGFLYEEWKDIW